MKTTKLQPEQGKVISLVTWNDEKLSRIAIPLKHKIEIIELDRILYMKSDSNYTEIHLTDQTRIVTSQTLKRYAEKLCGQDFLRVHQSFLIHKDSISCFKPKQSIIILHNSQEIPVSSSRKKALLNYLKTLMV